MSRPLATTTQGCFRLQATDAGPKRIEVTVTCLVCGEVVSQTRCEWEDAGALGALSGMVSRQHACWQRIKAEAN